jgi:hypothetical protein
MDQTSTKRRVINSKPALRWRSVVGIYAARFCPRVS